MMLRDLIETDGCMRACPVQARWYVLGKPSGLHLEVLHEFRRMDDRNDRRGYLVTYLMAELLGLDIASIITGFIAMEDSYAGIFSYISTVHLHTTTHYHLYTDTHACTLCCVRTQ